MKDTIIIGSGPAGISCALYLHQLNKDVLVLSKDLGQLTKHDMVENYYGFLPIPGDELIQKGIDQARALGIAVMMESVLDIEQKDNYYQVKTTLNTYQAYTVVLATGKPRLSLRIPGFTTFRGRGVHLCATCDGFFYKRKKIALIGSGAYMEQELKVLENFTKDILIFSNGHHFESTYPVITEPLKSLTGDQRVTHVNTITASYEIAGVFVAIGFPSANELALKLGILQEKSNILVDDTLQTNLPGVFAGGDCIGGKLQIAKAIYDGLGLSDGINKYLKKVK